MNHEAFPSYRAHTTEQKPSPEDALSIIQKEYPDSSVGALRPIVGGVSNYTFESTDGYIFRFSKPGDEACFKKGYFVLSQLEKHSLGVEVPRVVFYSEKELFMRYKKLEGEFLSFAGLEKVTPAVRHELARDIASFFEAFHSSIPVEEALVGGVPVARKRESSLVKTREAFATSEEKEVFGFLDIIEERIKTHPLLPYTPTLIHQDFHDGNMVVDPKTKRLKGVIDFDSVVVADVHEEFAQLYKRNPDFTAEVVAEYNKKSGRRVDIEAVRTYTLVRRLRKLAQYKHDPEGEEYKNTFEYIRKECSVEKER